MFLSFKLLMLHFYNRKNNFIKNITKNIILKEKFKNIDFFKLKLFIQNTKIVSYLLKILFIIRIILSNQN